MDDNFKLWEYIKVAPRIILLISLVAVPLGIGASIIAIMVAMALRLIGC